MDIQAPSVLNLDSLVDGVPALPAGAAYFFIQNCMVCLDTQGHQSGIPLHVKFDRSDHEFKLVWAEEVTEQHRRAYADLQDAVEVSATALAFSLVGALTEYTAVERAIKGTTVDYYLTDKPDEETLIFNNSARLEVSGILVEKDGNTVNNRVADKLKRLKRFGDSQPTFIVVVEHGRPWARMVKYHE